MARVLASDIGRPSPLGDWVLASSTHNRFPQA